MCDGKVTIAGIAEMLDVSPITVSRALSGQPGVSDELRQKIINKAKELGYKKIKCNDKSNILLIVGHKYYNENSNFGQKVQGIEKYIKKLGAEFIMEFIEKEKQENFETPYNISRGTNFDGVILMGPFENDYISFIKEKIKNVVIFNKFTFGIDCNFVHFNYNTIGYTATQYLINKGHRKIGFIGVEGAFANPQRYFGYTKALELNNIELNMDYVINTPEEMTDRVKQMINKGDLPTAFTCQSDRMALELIKLLHCNKISVPDQVSVIGIGNSEMSSISIPALTTFDLNIDYACEAAVRLVFERMNDTTGPNRVIYINATLVERDSVRDLTSEER